MGEVSVKFSEMISELNNNSDVVVLSRYVKKEEGTKSIFKINGK